MTPATTQTFHRFLPLGLAVLLLAGVWASGVTHYVSLEAVAQNRDMLKAFVSDHRVAAVAAFMAVYVATIALSLPGAAVLSILGGFLFGWMVSVPATVTAATLGGLIVFAIVRTALGHLFAERAGPFLRKLSDGLTRDAFHYLLFLRLTPVVPFFVVNAAAGLLHVKTSTFAVATLIGIIPAAIAYAFIGMGLDSVIDAQRAAHEACVSVSGEAACPFHIDTSALLTPQVVMAFAALGCVALIPVALKRWRTG